LKIQFLGANRQVTGSRYCLSTPQSQILIDCGMFQERDYTARNWECCPVPAGGLNAVVLTHAHIDHCGLLPRLIRDGYHGPIYATQPTVDLTKVMLRDAAKIQSEDVSYKQRRHQKKGKTSPFPYEPLYDERDVERTLKLLEGAHYYRPCRVTDDVTVTFHDAGHILGSACLDFNVSTPRGDRRIIFSGDIGQYGKPLIRDPSTFTSADYVIMESTYGDRLHENGGDIETQLADVINRTAKRGGKVIVPVFAVERAQELIYHIARLVHHQRVPDIPVFLDSPMAADVIEIFQQNRTAYDAETWNLISEGIHPLDFPGLRIVRHADESKAINLYAGSAVIMSTSGMCTAGRIKHHLKHNITDPRSTVLFVGYQSPGTLGRAILDKKPEVRIHGREFKAQAEIAQIFGFSGHADRNGLLHWIGAFQQPAKHLFLTHGDLPAAENIAATIREQGWMVTVPEYRQVIEIDE
jgi:metallo-beta-lactamase family protein